MALNSHLSIASVNMALNAAIDVLNGGSISIYTGTQSATPDVAISTQTKLVTLLLSATAFGAASSGSKVANLIVSGVALAAGTATWYRAFKSDGTTAVVDGSVGTSGANLNLDDTSITIGGLVSITSWTINMAQ